MKYLRHLLMLAVLLILTACDYTDFEATWQDPSIRPIDPRNEHLAALLLSANESVRRSFEDNLARQLNRHGVETTPGYQLVPEADATNKEELLADLKTTTADHAVFMRIIDREKQVRYIPGYDSYPGLYDDPFFWYDGPFVRQWGYGPWFSPYDLPYYQVDTIVSVETLVYSVPDSKLVWTGLSKTMNPSEVDRFVKELVSGAVKEMKKTGFFPS